MSNQKVEDYTIISAANFSKLQYIVNEHLRLGYHPIGGPGVSSTGVFQAVVKPVVKKEQWEQ